MVTLEHFNNWQISLDHGYRK